MIPLQFRKKLSVKFAVASIALVFLAEGGVSRGKALQEDESILILGNENLAPIVYRDDGEPSGLAVEIAKELEKYIGVSVNIETEEWSRAQEMLKNGEADALLHINKTPERTRYFEFSDPILESEISIFTNNSGIEIENIEALSGLAVGVEDGGFPESFLRSNQDLSIVEMPDLKEGFKSLKKGDLDVFVADKWAGSHVLATRGIEGIWITGSPITVQSSHIAVRKGDHSLLSSIDGALQKIKSDGTYQLILDNWEPEKTIFQTKEQISNYKLKMGIYASSIIAVILAVFGFTLFIQLKKSREKQKQIEYLSFHDHLTGLYSRYFFEREFERLDSKDFLPLSLILIDVNGLKLINDAFGHKKGDMLLKKVSESLKTECGHDGIVCRIGGDEFTVILPNTDSEKARELSECICRTLSCSSIESIPITASCGYSTKYRIEEDMSEVFRKAEDSMYHSKTSEKKSIRYNSINIIMKTLFEKTPREEAHSERVSELCAEIADEMGMSPGEAKMLNTAGLLHDIGKIAIGNSILDKEGPLDDREWSEVRKHPEISFNILSSVNDYGPLADVALSHHERWDGEGYPRKLAGKNIPLHARIIAVADTYDAMTSKRSYRDAISPEEAMAEIQRNSGKQFDPEVVEVFSRVFDRVLNEDGSSLLGRNIKAEIRSLDNLWLGDRL